MRVYRTKDGHWAGTRAAAGKGYELIDIPTDKPGLLIWLNENTVIMGHAEDEFEPANMHGQDGYVPELDEPDETTTPLDTDGFPVCRSAYTVAQVASSMLPKSTEVQDVCHLVAKMRAPELGYVALEVMARAAKLSGS